MSSDKLEDKSPIDGFDYTQTLSISQTPSLKPVFLKTPGKHGRKSHVTKMKEEIATSVQNTLDSSFLSLANKRPRRACCSPWPQ